MLEYAVSLKRAVEMLMAVIFFALIPSFYMDVIDPFNFERYDLNQLSREVGPWGELLPDNITIVDTHFENKTYWFFPNKNVDNSSSRNDIKYIVLWDQEAPRNKSLLNYIAVIFFKIRSKQSSRLIYPEEEFSYSLMNLRGDGGLHKMIVPKNLLSRFGVYCFSRTIYCCDKVDWAAWNPQQYWIKTNLDLDDLLISPALLYVDHVGEPVNEGEEKDGGLFYYDYWKVCKRIFPNDNKYLKAQRKYRVVVERILLKTEHHLNVSHYRKVYAVNHDPYSQANRTELMKIFKNQPPDRKLCPHTSCHPRFSCSEGPGCAYSCGHLGITTKAMRYSTFNCHESYRFASFYPARTSAQLAKKRRIYYSGKRPFVCRNPYETEKKAFLFWERAVEGKYSRLNKKDLVTINVKEHKRPQGVWIRPMYISWLVQNATNKSDEFRSMRTVRRRKHHYVNEDIVLMEFRLDPFDAKGNFFEWCILSVDGVPTRSANFRFRFSDLDVPHAMRLFCKSYSTDCSGEIDFFVPQSYSEGGFLPRVEVQHFGKAIFRTRSEHFVNEVPTGLDIYVSLLPLWPRENCNLEIFFSFWSRETYLPENSFYPSGVFTLLLFHVKVSTTYLFLYEFEVIADGFDDVNSALEYNVMGNGFPDAPEEHYTYSGGITQHTKTYPNWTEEIWTRTPPSTYITQTTEAEWWPDDIFHSTGTINQRRTLFYCVIAFLTVSIHA